MQTPENWLKKDQALYREFEFSDFSEAFAFMTSRDVGRNRQSPSGVVQCLQYREDPPDQSRCGQYRDRRRYRAG